MRFAFTDDQVAFREAVVDLLEQRCDATTLRAAWSNASGRAEGAWSSLHEMGVLDAMCAEADGGLDLSEVDVVSLLEATGRYALPEPIVETMMIAAPLGLVASGESAAVTLSESPYAAWADSSAVIVQLSADGIRAVPTSDVDLVERESVDGARRLFAVGFPESAPIRSNEVATAFRRGALGTAAQLLGLADRMIELTVEYAKERKQFGVPIGSFQAVKHHLADARIKLEFARPLVYRAAASMSAGDPEAGIHVAMAKATASDAATIAARKALQCHGAIGYTTEYDLHLYMKRAWALSAAWGDAAWHRRRVTASLLSPTT